MIAPLRRAGGSGRPAGPQAGATTAAGAAAITLDLGGLAATLYVRRHPRARRTMLRIGADGESVVLVLPPRRSVQEGLAVVEAHKQWIRERLARMPARIAFVDGAALPVLGRPLTIRHRPADAPGVRKEGSDLLVGGATSEVGRRVLGWLRDEARRTIAALAGEKAIGLGRSITRITIRDTRSRWGSCSAAGALSFSWRLVLAPPDVLDYVVAHEVAHLRHRGHGPGFWNEVARLSAASATARAWLRHDGATLFRYG